MDRTPVKNGETRDRAGEEASGELVGGVPPEEASALLKPSGVLAAEGGVSMASGEPRPSLDGMTQRIFGGLGEADGELLHLSGRRRHWALGEASIRGEDDCSAGVSFICGGCSVLAASTMTL